MHTPISINASNSSIEAEVCGYELQRAGDGELCNSNMLCINRRDTVTSR